MVEKLQKCRFIFYPDSPQQEILTFEMNPDEVTPPVAEPRNENSFYITPHRVFQEDGVISISNGYAPKAMLDRISYYVESYKKPFVYLDYLGRDFLVCFSSFNRPARKIKGKNLEGFEIVLQVVVLH